MVKKKKNSYVVFLQDQATRESGEKEKKKSELIIESLFLFHSTGFRGLW